MKIFGHPLHIMLIHFPSALFPMELVCYGLYWYTGQPSFGTAAFYTLSGGVVLGWLATVFGAIDMIKIPQSKPEVLKKALVHGSINVSVVIVYTVFFAKLAGMYPQIQPPFVSLLVVKCLLVLFMIVGNYIGGSLILKHKLGVENE